MKYSFTIIIKPFIRVNPTLDDMRKIYIGNTCIVAKNSKHGGLYLNNRANIIKGNFRYNSGSVRYPVLIAQSEVHIKVTNFHLEPIISTDQYKKQDIISIINH